MQTVEVKFLHGYTTYSYLYDGVKTLKQGDPVIVDSPKDGFVVVTVTSVTQGRIGKATKFVVDTIDVDVYNARKAKELRLAEVKAQLNAKVKAFNEIAVFQMMAKTDEEAAALLTELATLTN